MTAHLFFFWFTVTAGPVVAAEYITVHAILAVTMEPVLGLSGPTIVGLVPGSILGVDP
jgi:hypothetical protein